MHSRKAAAARCSLLLGRASHTRAGDVHVSKNACAQSVPAATAGGLRHSRRRFGPLAASPSWYLLHVVAQMKADIFIRNAGPLLFPEHIAAFFTPQSISTATRQWKLATIFSMPSYEDEIASVQVERVQPGCRQLSSECQCAEQAIGHRGLTQVEGVEPAVASCTHTRRDITS